MNELTPMRRESQRFSDVLDYMFRVRIPHADMLQCLCVEVCRAAVITEQQVGGVKRKAHMHASTVCEHNII